jgi:hypothetical protein
MALLWIAVGLALLLTALRALFGKHGCLDSFAFAVLVTVAIVIAWFVLAFAMWDSSTKRNERPGNAGPGLGNYTLPG